MQKIFIGVLFLFFHFRINGIDLLPQFVGYLLIGFGFEEMQKTDQSFANRSKLFYLFSALQLFGTIAITIYAAPYADEVVLYLLLIISACMVIYSLYCIYQAVRDSEQQVGELGAPRLKTWWIIYITIALLEEIFRFIPRSQAIVNVLSIILAFGGMVTLIAYSVVLYQTMNLYKNREIMLTAQAESNENPTDNF